MERSNRLHYQRGRALCRLHLKCDGTGAETRFRLSAKRTSPFKSAGASVQSTAGSRGVRISGSNAGYIIFRGSVKSTGYPLHSPVSPSLPLPSVTVCHHISTGVYLKNRCRVGPRAVLHAGPMFRPRVKIILLSHGAHVPFCMDIITLFRLSRVHVGHLSD